MKTSDRKSRKEWTVLGWLNKNLERALHCGWLAVFQRVPRNGAELKIGRVQLTPGENGRERGGQREESSWQGKMRTGRAPSQEASSSFQATRNRFSS